ncbi:MULTISPECIES: ABC transporter permease [Desulfosediminicola]|uniref:ABC transporter permease n=1 Tax=Desulfosediminicola TaxID=2886823 RepID=UPI001C3CA58E|nr:ABC transporter permease [Desulfosediminicola ganghwensis]
MLPSLVKRQQISKSMVYLSPVLAFVLSLLAGVILFIIMGVSPLAALHSYFVEPLSSSYNLAELAVKATPLVLIGVALSLGFKAGVWNIGAEGQLTMGGLCGGVVALYFYDQQGFYILPLMLAAGMAGGMAWAGIVAFLRVRFNANEILTSLMLSYVAGLFLNLMVHGPLKDPDGFNFPESRLFGDSAMLPILIEGTRLHVGALMALIAVGLGWVIISRTLLGYQIKVAGSAPAASAHAGFSGARIIWITLLIGGAMAGLAGVIEVSGPIGQLLPSISPGYGFTAIIVAYVGRLHPVGALFAGILLALTYLGGEMAQIQLNLPVAVTGVFQGLLLFFLLACDVLIHYRVQFGKPALAREKR